MRSLGSAAQLILMNGPLGAMAAMVDGVGEQLLAGPVLALNQHVGIAGRDRLDELEEREHRLALAEDVLEGMLLLQARLQPQMLPPLVHQVSRPIDQAEQALGIQVRLVDEVEGAGLSGLERALQGALAADHDHLEPLVDPLERAKHVDAVGVRQQQVEQHDRRLVTAARLLGAEARVGGHDPVARDPRRLLDARSAGSRPWPGRRPRREPSIPVECSGRWSWMKA